MWFDASTTYDQTWMPPSLASSLQMMCISSSVNLMMHFFCSFSTACMMPGPAKLNKVQAGKAMNSRKNIGIFSTVALKRISSILIYVIQVAFSYGARSHAQFERMFPKRVSHWRIASAGVQVHFQSFLPFSHVQRDHQHSGKIICPTLLPHN